MGRALVALVAIAGCVRPGAYHCRQNTECVVDGMQGVCEALGYCSFPDGSCDGGFRYGAYAGQYANQCVNQDNSGFYRVGGTVKGLEGTGLVLRNNGADDLRVRMAGPFSFAAELMAGEPYEVTIATLPSNPEQMCVINNASGIASQMDITDIEVTCSTKSYLVGGTVVGLAGTGLVLTNKGGDDLPVSASGAFTFPTQVLSGDSFTIAIKTQPGGQTCDVSGATGTVGTANVSTVVINCNAGTYTLGGSVTGLAGTLLLRNNGGDTASVTALGSFAFATPLAPAASYDVTVYAQPMYPPLNQTCTIAMGSGNMPASNVTSVAVSCATNSFSVGGSVLGLVGSLVVQNNGVDTLTINSNGAFTMPMPVLSGNTYAISITQQPANQTCSVSTNPSGVITNGNITNVAITCASGTDPGILCGSVYCDPKMELCCIDNGTPECATSCTGTGMVPIRCDDQADCAAAGQSQSICCGLPSSDVTNIYCTTADHCAAPHAYYCDPALANPCPNGGTCTATNSPFPGWYRCY